jgi:hypothetical protein
MVIDQTVSDPIIAAFAHSGAKMVERLLCRLRRHDPFNISLQIFHYRNSPLAMAQFYCNLRLYAGLYRNQQKNGRIEHKIAENGRITIGKFRKENPREIVCSHSARRTRRPVLFRPLHPLRSLPLSIGKIRPAHSS